MDCCVISDMKKHGIKVQKNLIFPYSYFAAFNIIKNVGADSLYVDRSYI